MKAFCVFLFSIFWMGIIAAPALNVNATIQVAQLRQFSCGSTTPVNVNKGYQGRFASPNYPGSYGTSRDCIWLMTTSTDAEFTLICDPLSVSCPGDYIIYSPSGDITFKDASKPVCGAGKLQVTLSSKIAIAFHSSSYSKGGAFSCVAQALPKPVTTKKPSPSCSCGIKGQTRIVGGQTAGVTEWPWQALLADISQSGGGNQYCGATLIAASWVITAAHCTFNRIAANIAVVVGQYNTKTLSSTAQVRKVLKIIQHPSFSRATVDNDIAMLQLDSPVVFNAAVRPICLPIRYANYDFNNEIGTITGWGTTSFGGSLSSNLLEVSVPILTSANCKRNANIGSKITDNMFCTYADGKDACQGDSGGPLNWVDPKTSQVHLVGITSWGTGCARKDYPGVYTKVTNYLGWIQSYTGSLCSP